MRLFQPLISALIAVSTLAPLFAQDPPRPTYQFMRYDEDWSVLSDRSRRSDWLDSLKFISFGAPGWYVTFGGEIRESWSCSMNRDLTLDRQTKPDTFCSAICFPQTFILALASASLPNYQAASRKAEKAADGRRSFGSAS